MRSLYVKISAAIFAVCDNTNKNGKVRRYESHKIVIVYVFIRENPSKPILKFCQ